ncbi:hypothetical protein BpHYR1_040893 [Brachionus plicatilis]|uniref:Uncharacterized protein n=1 Tax=Brachionus plicatilis TaxID=10195 RepID=A0A3M7RRX7_BRAPC|nr:hypothetical protein BpHYR1_040893 [Brachionus plicatilis]
MGYITISLKLFSSKSFMFYFLDALSFSEIINFLLSSEKSKGKTFMNILEIVSKAKRDILKN